MLFFYFILFFLGSNLKANAFTEIFGSEGAAGINNPKIRSLSYAFQYLTFSGSIGYIGKQLFDSGFLVNVFVNVFPLSSIVILWCAILIKFSGK